MQSHDPELCRAAASECVELAKISKNPRTKELLLAMAQSWLKRAYLRDTVNLDRQIADFNQRQMAPRDAPGSEA